jgi:hypothetical protein
MSSNDQRQRIRMIGEAHGRSTGTNGVPGCPLRWRRPDGRVLERFGRRAGAQARPAGCTGRTDRLGDAVVIRYKRAGRGLEQVADCPGDLGPPPHPGR